MDDLQKDIAALSRANLDDDKLESLASELQLRIKSFSLDPIFHFYRNHFFLILMVVLLFPCLFRLVLRSIHSIQHDITKMRLKNKKPGNATLTPLLSV